MTIKIKYDKDGNIKSIKAPLPDDGTTGRTRMNRAALELWKGNVKPTTWFKFKRFFRRGFDELSLRAEAAYAYHIVGSPEACEAPRIGIEERSYEWE